MLNSRAKGKRGELELVHLLQERGFCCERNLEQTRGGGSDISGLPISLEVKRREKLALTAWWQQTAQQAESDEKPPVLAYRTNGTEWTFLVGMSLDELTKYMESLCRS